MNHIATTAILSSLLALAAPIGASADDTEFAHTRVSFHEPTTYTDIDYDGMNTEKGRQIVLDHIRSVFTEVTDNWLPPGYSLNVTVFDIDLAGQYEPHRGADFPRIVKDIYTPKIKFEYRVHDPEGVVVREGAETLSDKMFLSNPARAIRADNEVAYDVSTLIRDWGRAMKRKEL